MRNVLSRKQIHESGRKFSDQIIDGDFVPINISNAPAQMYFYSITDQLQQKASGKLMIAK